MFPCRTPGRHDVFGRVVRIRMSRHLASLTLDRIDDLPGTCRQCVFWELDPAVIREAPPEGGPVDPAFDKEAWVSDTLLSWGSCGTVVYVDDEPAGYALYAPPSYLPRAAAFPTSPVGADAVLLAALNVAPEHRGGGLGRMLVQEVVRDLARRDVRAVEAFGASHPPGETLVGEFSCVVPADFLLAVGFRTVKHHRRWPRLRLDVDATTSWRAEAEAAIERLVEVVRPAGAPAGAPVVSPFPA
jgi:GNAT superfamily N-acetyltransferase